MSSGDLVFGAIQDGKLRVFKWPSMEIILDVSNAHAPVKDLDFRFSVIDSLNSMSAFDSHCGNFSTILMLLTVDFGNVMQP